MLTRFQVSAPRTLQFGEYEEPALLPHQVRLRTRISGIKQGTEMALYTGATPFRTSEFDQEWRAFVPRNSDKPFYPVGLGSWAVGEVSEIGPDVTRFKPGDLAHGSMFHQPTNTMAEADLFALAPGLPAEGALFTDPALFALAAVHDAQVKVGDQVAVFGCGVLGLLAAQIARLQGATQVIVVDVLETRLALARRMGADIALNPRDCDAGLEIKRLTGRKGVDAAIEFSGAYSGLQAAIRSVQQGGIVACAGYYKTGQTGLELGAEWHHNRPQMISSMPVWGNPLRCHPMWTLQRLRETALGLLEAGRLIWRPMVTHRFAYADAAAAYALIDTQPAETMKIVLDYPEEK